MPPTTVGVLATFNVSLFPTYLNEALSRYGLHSETFLGEHGQIAQQILDPTSPLYTAAPENLLIIPAVEDMLTPLFTRPGALSEGEVESLINDQIAELAGLLEAVLEQLPSTTCYLVTFGSESAPMEHILGAHSFSRGQAAVERWMTSIKGLASKSPRVVVVDWDWHVRSGRLANYSDERLWYLGRMRLNPVGLAGLAELVARHVSAYRGLARKVAVVDLDNTVWGGVVGEVGLKGLELGPEGIGLAYQDFQRELVKLHDAGVVLAVCSKNNLEDAWDVFDQHSGMILQKEHIAAHRINWQDKATNLVELSEELGLGLDSFLLLDDSPVERAWVQTALPEVLAPDLPEDPCYRPGFLRDAAFFQRINLTDADLRRARTYKEQALRNDLRQGLASLDEFLASLDQNVTIIPVEQGSLGRAAQMCQRTNQFNLTSPRYTVSDMESLISDGSIEAYTLAVSDRFGDSGVTGLAILRFQEDEAIVDTFLLSCRVLGRKVEDVFLGFLTERARQRSASRLIGSFLPTAKNKQVENFYPDRGFSPVDGQRFSLDLEAPRQDFPGTPWVKVTTHA